MALDPSIPLSYQPPQVTSPMQVAQGMMTLQDAMQTRELKQLQLQDYMETKQKYQKVQQAAQNKSYYDPQKGGWTPEGLGAVMTIDPELGSKIQSAQERSTMMASQLQSQQLQQQQLRIKQQEVSSSVLDDARKQAASVWEQSEGMDPAKRAELYNSTWSKAIESKKSLLMSANIDEKDIQHEMQNPPDPRQAKAASMSPKDIMDQKRKDEEQKRKDEAEKRLENKPESPEGKINSDYKKGFITREQRDAALQKKSGTSNYDDASIDMLAQNYRVTGKMEGIAWGDKTTRAKVVARAVQQNKEAGINSSDVPFIRAEFQATSKALNDRTKFLATLSQFTKNFDLQMNIVEKYTDTGAVNLNKALNKWVQNGRTALANDPGDVVNLDVAIRGAAREHQRIVTGVTSNAQLHVAAQQTADELLNKAQTPAAIRRTLSVMREETKNAIASGRSEVAELGSTLRKIGEGAPGIDAETKKRFGSPDPGEPAAIDGPKDTTKAPKLSSEDEVLKEYGTGKHDKKWLEDQLYEIYRPK